MKKLLAKRKKLNNKGFTLVEMIIAFTMLGVLALGVYAVMSAGATMFTRTNADINVQYKSQTAMAQFQQSFMSCSKAICNTDSDNVTYFADGSNIYALKYDSVDKKVYYKEVPYGGVGNAGAIQLDLAPGSITDLFCSNVEGFRVDVIGTGSKATSVKVTLTILSDTGSTYQTSQIFTFRASPDWIQRADDELVDGNGESSILYTMITKLITA